MNNEYILNNGVDVLNSGSKCIGDTKVIIVIYYRVKILKL